MKIGHVVTSRTAAPDRMSAVKLRWSVQLRRMATIGSWLRSKKELITHLGDGRGVAWVWGEVVPAAPAATAQAQQPRQPRQPRQGRLRPEVPAAVKAGQR